MFHVGGGIDVLNISKRRATPSGVFCRNRSDGSVFGLESGGGN